MKQNELTPKPRRRTTEHLAPREERDYMQQTEDQARLCQVKRKIDAIHEIQALGRAVSEVWDDIS